MADLESNASLIPTQTKRCSSKARIPGSNSFELYDLELGLHSITYTRTFRPSFFASKVTESGELFLDDAERARPLNPVMVNSRQNVLYMPLKKQQLLYIEAASRADQQDWLTRIETNITKAVYLERLRCPTAQAEHCPPDRKFGEAVLLCCPAVLSKAAKDEPFMPAEHGKLLVLSRSLVFESSNKQQHQEQQEQERIDIVHLIDVTTRTIDQMIVSEDRHAGSVPIAGACCGDLMLYSSDGTRWSVQLSTEMALEQVADMLCRIRESKQQEGSHFETLSPKQRRTEADWDENYLARLDSIDSRLERLFSVRFHVTPTAPWAEYKGCSAPCNLSFGESSCNQFETEQVRVWYAQSLIGVCTNVTASNSPVSSSRTATGAADMSILFPAKQLVSVEREELCVRVLVASFGGCEPKRFELDFDNADDAAECQQELMGSIGRSEQMHLHWPMWDEQRFHDAHQQRWMQLEHHITGVAPHGSVFRREVWRDELWDESTKYEQEFVDRLGFSINEGLLESTSFDWAEDDRTNSEREGLWEAMASSRPECWNQWDQQLAQLARAGLPHKYRGMIWFKSSGAQLKQAANDPKLYTRLSGRGFSNPATFSALRLLTHSSDKQQLFRGVAVHHPAAVVATEAQAELEKQVDKDLDMRTYSSHSLLKLSRVLGMRPWNQISRTDLGAHDQLPPSAGLVPSGLIQPIRRICFAFDKYRPDIGYTQGMAPVVALLLMLMPEEMAFWTFTAIYEDMIPGIMSSTSGECQPGMMALRSYNTKKLREFCPELVEHCEYLWTMDTTLPHPLMMLIDSIIGPNMLQVACAEMPPYVTLRVLDLFFCEGPQTMFATSIAIFMQNKELILAQTDPMELVMTSEQLKRNMAGAFHHREDSTTKLLTQIIETVGMLGDVETTLKDSLEETEHLVRQKSDEILEIQKTSSSLRESMLSSLSSLSEDTDVDYGGLGPVGTLADVWLSGGSPEQQTEEQLEEQLAELHQEEATRMQSIERLSLRMSWIGDRSSEHEDWKQRIAGSAAPTFASRIMDDWHSHVSVHALGCLWQQASSHAVRDVRIVLGMVTDPNATDPNDNMCALHKCIQAEASFNVFGLNREELYQAGKEAQFRKERTVEVLIAHPDVDINRKTPDGGRTPLHLAAYADAEALAIIAILLSQGARVDIADCNGFTPLHVSASHASFAAVTHLLMAATEQGVLSQVINGATHIRKHTPLHMVARGSSRDGCTRSMTCQTLIEARADPSVSGRLGETALHVAARWGDPDMIKVLVHSGASVNRPTTGSATTPLHLAVEELEVMSYGYSDDSEWELVEREKKASSTFTGYECCLRLLQLKAEPDSVTQGGWSPLLMAARRGNSELCDLLLKLASMNAAAISQATTKGWGCLHMGALSGSATTCEMLLRLGADKSKEATVHMLDGSPSNMTPENLAKHLHQNDDVYSQYCAGHEFGRDETPRGAMPPHVEARLKIHQAKDAKERKRRIDTDVLTQANSPDGAASEGNECTSSFDGVLQVFDGGVNPEDAHAVYSSEVVNIITQFNRCGF